MQTVKAHDRSVIVVLSRAEIKAVLNRLSQHTGVQRSKVLDAAQQKIQSALDVHIWARSADEEKRASEEAR